MPTILRSPSGPAGGTLPGFASVDGGLVVDLSVMRSVRVDVDEQTAWVQGGANGADLHAETLTYGLAGIAGWTNAVGLGGFLLHGGYGCLSAKLGLGVDTILELEVVSANGEVLRVTPSENPDLFWAARGAGSNFGVVTWMKVQLVPVPEQVLAGVLVYDAVEATELLEHLNELNGRVPDDMMFMAHMAVLPGVPAYPEEPHGKLVVDVMIVHVGSLAQAGADVRGLRRDRRAHTSVQQRPHRRRQHQDQTDRTPDTRTSRLQLAPAPHPPWVAARSVTTGCAPGPLIQTLARLLRFACLRIRHPGRSLGRWHRFQRAGTPSIPCAL
ncbi:FAD-binding oxidoreductase [Streptomyces noursei]|nr:FAD-binding protein [Streptomyces noursei]QRX89648.1 FAD-binding oxidoreductase [Streptomyces noursei]